ncbi:MAG: NmrA family NAD(P)-binding protein [Methylocystaceae bacterium]|nr:NmrA family NAD(P)-binding protein [Methylocystaceae bacterium]
MFVISGVTGNTGSVAAQTLLDAGKDVRVIVRSAEKGQVWKDKGAEVAIADFFDLPAMTEALRGAQGAYLMQPPDVGHDDFLTRAIRLSEILVEAAKDANVGHVTFLSSVGAHLGVQGKTGPIRTAAYLESAFHQSALKTTAIRPAYFLENWSTIVPAVLNDNILPSFLHPLDLKIDMVATRDIGEQIAKSLLEPAEEAHRVIELKGAQQYSARDIAQAFAKSLKTDITPIEVPKEGWTQTFIDAGLSPQTAELYVEMYDNVNNGAIDFTQANAARGQVSLDEFFESMALQKTG